MASELDKAIDAVMAQLMAPGAPAEVAEVDHDGARVPSLVHAPVSLVEYFERYCTQHADATFLVDGEIRLSFGETLAAARQLAGGLVAGHGVKTGDRIGIAARNGANWVVAYMAALMSGGVAVLVNGFWNGLELAEGIRLVGCTIVIADDSRIDRLQGQDIAGAKLLRMGHDAAPLQGLASLLDRGEGGALPVMTGDDYATILFTSGSTGQSKGAASTHRAVTQGTMCYAMGSAALKMLMAAKGMTFTVQPSTLMNVPLFHVTGEIPVMLQSIAAGRKLVMMPRWDAEEAMRLIQAEKITYFTGVPLMSYEMMTHPKRDQYDLSSCTMMAAGGAPRPVEHVKRIADSMDPGGAPGLGYGLTETNGVGCSNFADNYIAKPASTGRPMEPVVRLAILDDDGNPVSQGQSGEVAFQSVAMFTCYWDNPEATAAAFTADRWFLTGDVGYLDEDGYLFLVDRKKDIIIRGGENISCAEVEAAAYDHEGVAEVSVFPVPDERYGEVPGLVYYAKPGGALSSDELCAFMAQRIAPFKLPVHVWEVTEPLPRLGTQKIDRVSLKRDYGALAAEAA